MEQYISKYAIVAEIEKRINFNEKLNAHSRLDECNAILSFLDTLEVKEVDLEKEIQVIWSINQKYVDSLFIPMNYNGLHEIAKHFFELGLKAQKGE